MKSELKQGDDKIKMFLLFSVVFCNVLYTAWGSGEAEWRTLWPGA